MTRHAFDRASAALLAALTLLLSTALPSRAETQDGAAEARSAAIAAAYIPATADVDQKFVQSALRRAKADDVTDGLERRLTVQAQSLKQLAGLTHGSDLSRLSVRRLESLERHWLLHERTIRQTRAELSRATNAASEDAAQLAKRRSAWSATRDEADLAPALRERAAELVVQIES